MSSKVLNTSVSLDDLSASELNAAIDDTNFPGTKCPSSTVGAVEAGASSAAAAVVGNTTVVAAGKTVLMKPSNGVGGGQSVLKEEEEEETGVKDTNHTNPKKLTLKIQANGEHGSNNNTTTTTTPGHVTPWTPRTSTTPG